jgi:gas vesicle protein
MYSNEQQANASGFITGLLCGAAVGAALGIVLAPRSGAATRQQLAETGGRLRNKMSETYTKASEGVSKAMARGSQAVEEGREAFEQARPSGTEGGFGSLGAADYPGSRGI